MDHGVFNLYTSIHCMWMLFVQSLNDTKLYLSCPSHQSKWNLAVGSASQEVVFLRPTTACSSTCTGATAPQCPAQSTPWTASATPWRYGTFQPHYNIQSIYTFYSRVWQIAKFKMNAWYIYFKCFIINCVYNLFLHFTNHLSIAVSGEFSR